MRNYFIDFLSEFEYPADSVTVLTEGFDRIFADPSSSTLFCEAIGNYDKSIDFDEGRTLRLCEAMALLTGVHEYTVKLIVFICMSKKLRERYREKGISDDIFYGSMCDLRYKLYECKNVKGIDGSFVAFWFPGFFKMNRFQIGRLQYEIVPFRKGFHYEKGGVILSEGMKVVNVHIPSSGLPLTPEVCDESFAMATEFFREAIGDAPLAFVCNSWLLYPKTAHLFSPKSNTAAFIKRFDIISEHEDAVGVFPDMWRVFNMDYTGNAADYPADTSMRRAFRDYILGGGRTGSGYGVILYPLAKA